ncbi:MAG: D-aminoacyl-tRNA deacylase [Phycisphaerae bacterium]
MRAVVQRVTGAAVQVEGKPHADIQAGLLVYLGVAADDTEQDARRLARKVRYLRIFDDAEGRMNRDVAQADGTVLAVSAFTVMADTRKGRRPSYALAARPEPADKLFDIFCQALAEEGLPVACGVFQTYMQVTSTNDGPVCILLDSDPAANSAARDC